MLFYLRAIGTALALPGILALFFYFKDTMAVPQLKSVKKIRKADEFNKKYLIEATVMSFLALFGLYFTTNIVNVSNSNDFLEQSIMILCYYASGIIFFLMLYKSKINRYRKWLFILFSIMFPVGFFVDLYQARGHIYFFQFEDMVRTHIPFCHMVIPQTLLPALTEKKVVFPGVATTVPGWDYTISSMVAIWISISFALGRGWCSWTCFWGGWEELFANLRKKPVIKKIDSRLRWFPYAIVIVSIGMTLLLVVPFYCAWLCPFKAVSETNEIISFKNVLQTGVFVILFIGLVIVLPLLTKKRTQCMFLCPFGAFQSLVDKVNVFKIRIDTEKCNNCKTCIRVCPVMSISEDSIKKGSVGFSCIKCNTCIDHCPQNAISHHIKGTPCKGTAGVIFSHIAKYSFLLIAFILIGTMAIGTIRGGMYLIIKFMVTGVFKS